MDQQILEFIRINDIYGPFDSESLAYAGFEGVPGHILASNGEAPA